MPEAESEALANFMQQHGEWVSAAITVTELVRATQRRLDAIQARARERRLRIAEAEALARRVALLDVDAPLLWSAARLQPSSLRSLDAVHLAAAITVADDVEAFVTYDNRLANAATAIGLAVVSPP